MRRKVFVPLVALLGVLHLASPGWAPPPPVFRPPPPPPPRPTPATPGRSPTTSVPRNPGATYRPPVGGARAPVHVAPAFAASLDAARRRSAAEAAELLRQQSAASLGRAQRAALLNAVTHDMLRQQQAASLAELRKLRADWVAVGPGAGLDPVVAMQLEAAESAAERLLLADILKLIAEGQFAAALAKFEPLESPRYLPAAVVLALPELRAALARVAPFARTQAELGERNWTEFDDTWAPLAAVPRDRVPADLRRAADRWRALVRAYNVVRADSGIWGHHSVAEIEAALGGVTDAAGPELARRLRAELAAKLFLDGRAADAVKLLDGGVDPVHAAAVRNDLRAAMLGGGEFVTPQVAEFVPGGQITPPPPALAAFPPEKLAGWKVPARKPGFPTVVVAASDARKALRTAVDAEVAAGAPKVRAAADRIRAALDAEAGPLKAFLAKIEAARGKPFATPAEQQLAVTAGTRGLTVAEVVGVFAVEADRPAAAARLLATAPALTDVGTFAAVVELSGRAPAGFAPHPDAGFKLPPTADRARVRAAVAASLHAQAGAIVAGHEGAPFDRPALEADVRNRLGFAPESRPTPAELVYGLLDVCRDWATERARLVETLQDLNETIAEIEAGEYGPEDDELKELTTLVKMRRLSVQTDKKRREVGLEVGCRLLGTYGADAAPARDWLRAQATGADTPWRRSATTALELLGAK